MREKPYDRYDINNTCSMSLLILLLVTLLPPLPSINSIDYRLASDIVITEPTVWEDEVVEVSGNIIIENGGNLTLINTTIVMKPSSNGQYNIYVKPGGALWIVDGSTIESGTNYKYSIYVEEGGKLYGRDSFLYDLGYSSTTGLRIKGNATHTGDADLYNMTIEASAIYVYNATLDLVGSRYNGTTSSTNLLYIDTSGIVNIYNTCFGLIDVSAYYLLKVYFYKDTHITLDNVYAKGSFTYLIYSVAKYATDNRAYIVVRDSYLEDTTIGSYMPIYIRNTNLTIKGSTIKVPESDRVSLLSVEVSTSDLYIIDSTLLGGRSSIYYHGYSTDLSNRHVVIRDSVLDKGISFQVTSYLSFEPLVIENTSNALGEPLVYYRDTTPPSTIDSGYQVILVNTHSSTTIDNLELDSVVQPIIVYNSSVEITNTVIRDNYCGSSQYDPTVAVLGLYNSSIYLYNTSIESVVSVLEDYTIYLYNSRLLDIRDSTIDSQRQYCIRVVTASVNPVKTTVYIRDTGFIIKSGYTISTSGYGAYKPSITLYNTTWTTPLSNYPSFFYIVDGELYVRKSYIAMYASGPVGSDIRTIFLMGSDSVLYVENSHIIRLSGYGGDIVYTGVSGSNITITNSTLEIMGAPNTYAYRGYVVYVGGESYVNITGNNVYGPGAGYFIGFVGIYTSLASSNIYIVDNNVSGMPIGIFFSDKVDASYRVSIEKIRFIDMGGIWFMHGSNVYQYITDVTIKGEGLVYIVNTTNTVVSEESSGIGEVIIVNSRNITIEDLLISDAVVGIAVYDSQSIIVDNVSIVGVQTSVHGVLVSNTSDVTIQWSTINMSQTPVYLSYPGLVEAVESTNLSIVYSNLTYYETPYYTSSSTRSIVYLEDSTDNTIVDSRLEALVDYVHGVYSTGSELYVEDTWASVENNVYVVYSTSGSRVNIVGSEIHGWKGVYAYSSLYLNVDNTSFDTHYEGVQTFNTAGWVRDTTITVDTGNDITISSTEWFVVEDVVTYNEGIQASNGEKLYLNNITVYTNAYGVKLSSMEHVVINNSNIEGVSYTSSIGVDIRSSKYVAVINSSIHGFQKGIYVSSSNAIVVNTRVYDNSWYGVYVYSLAEPGFKGYYLDIAGNGNSTTKYDRVYVEDYTSGVIEIHYSNITSNGRLGVYAEGYVNATLDYWGSTTGPELLDDASLADWVDPEEILDPGNESLVGNNLDCQPYDSSPVSRETVRPWGYIEAPENNSIVFGLVEINVTDGDNQGVALSLLFDDRLEGVVYGTNTSYYWDSSTVDDGLHKVTLMTIDYAGNFNKTVYYYRVSNVHPYVEIVSPENYTWVSGKYYPIKIYGSDNNPDKMEIYVNEELKKSLYRL